MNKSKKLLASLLIILGFLGVYFYVKGKSQTTPSINKETAQKSTASLIINDVPNTKQFDVSQYVGKTALEATQANASVVVSGSGVNAFVTAIDGREADGKKREFWELLINEKPAEVGAGSYIIQNTDLLRWHINTY